MDDLNVKDMADRTLEAIREKISNLNHLNIIVAGKTGVGKSTLVNAMFREDLVETGIGHPVTKHMRKIEKKDYPLSIFDTRGFELGKDAQENVLNEINETISERNKSDDINKKIHCLWYCINTLSNRVEDSEIKWLKEFTAQNNPKQVPVIVVLTQAINKQAALKMKNYILAQGIDIAQVVILLAKDYKIGPDINIPAYGLDTLLNVMTSVLPEELHETLQNVQRASLDAKLKSARKVVGSAAATAVAIAASPIPVADAALLVPNQIAMIAGITTVFGVEINKSLIIAFISATLGTSLSTNIGRAISASLLKLIPGAGTIGGAVLSSSTAAVVTTALGEAYIGLMTAVYKGEISEDELDSKSTKDYIKDLFKKHLKLEKNKKDELEAEDKSYIEADEKAQANSKDIQVYDAEFEENSNEGENKDYTSYGPYNKGHRKSSKDDKKKKKHKFNWKFWQKDD